MTYMGEQQKLETATTVEPTAVPLVNEIGLHAPEQQYRAGAYSLLAALMRDVPSVEVLQQAAGLSELAQDKDDLGLAMSMLGLAAQHSDPASVDDEYHDLFIGLGRGEVVPYGSWYLTGFLMEKPLGQLRDDLAQLGYKRDPSVCEPEDHVAALCEVMSMLIQENRSTSVQSQFLTQHMSKWLDRFIRLWHDLAQHLLNLNTNILDWKLRSQVYESIRQTSQFSSGFPARRCRSRGGGWTCYSCTRSGKHTC